MRSPAEKRRDMKYHVACGGPLPLLALAAAVCVGGLVACEDASGSEKSAESASDERGLVGSRAPDFSLVTVTGSKEKLALADLRGQVVVVDFWGTFCEPCKRSFPKLQ